MANRYYTELKAAFKEIREMDISNCGEEQLFKAVDRARCALYEYVVMVMCYTEENQEQKKKLRDKGVDEDEAMVYRLFHYLYGRKTMEGNAVLSEAENKALYYATYEKFAKLTYPGGFVATLIENGVKDALEKKTVEIAFSLNELLCGDDGKGTAMEEIVHADNQKAFAAVNSTESAEQVAFGKFDRSATGEMMTMILNDLARKNAMAFVAASTMMLANCDGKRTVRSANKLLAGELQFLKKEAKAVYGRDKKKAGYYVAAQIWKSAIDRYTDVEFPAEKIAMPAEFACKVCNLLDASDDEVTKNYAAAAAAAKGYLGKHQLVKTLGMKHGIAA